jgi:hypothetical protein
MYGEVLLNDGEAPWNCSRIRPVRNINLFETHLRLYECLSLIQVSKAATNTIRGRAPGVLHTGAMPHGSAWAWWEFHLFQALTSYGSGSYFYRQQLCQVGRPLPCPRNAVGMIPDNFVSRPLRTPIAVDDDGIKGKTVYFFLVASKTLSLRRQTHLTG